MTSTTSTAAATATTPSATSAPAFNPQPDPPGAQALVDNGFDINNFHLVYSLALFTTPEYTNKSLHSADYHLVPRVQPGHPGFDALSPYNTANTPFLIPSAAKMFGGQLAMVSHSSIPVYWRPRGQFMTQGNIALTQSLTGQNHFDTPVTGKGAVQPGQTALCGWTPILATHQWSFQPNDLPLLQPVHLQFALHTFSDQAFANPLTDTTPADDVIGVWVMRTT
jgi:hypothetical protein